MNLGTVLLKTAAVILLLFLLSLAGAISFPAAATIASGTGTGLSGLLLFLAVMIVLSIVGNLIGRGIRTIKQPLEALILAFVGSFFMGAILIIFTVLNLPGTARINLGWLGTSWYSSFLAMLLIGAPLMLVFIVTD
jgi:hypothetical protein